MLKKLMGKQKNNKGFSLVELIVVVLIIAIIAVALAPQVMKWVGTSKESVDKNNAASIKTAVSTAVADFMSKGHTVKTAGSYLIDDDGIESSSISATGENGIKLDDFIKEIMNGSYPSPQDNQYTHFKVVVSTSGAVTVNPVKFP